MVVQNRVGIMDGGVLLIEPTTPYFRNMFKVKNILAYARSRYQEIVLADIEGFGKSLVIDDLIQSTERDEYLYHESLVHPAMVLHPNPRRVLLIGGGEGAALREVLKHNVVEKAVMVDIDEVVVDFSKKYLEFIHQNSFYDERAEVVIMDGFKYIREQENGSFDVVILDLTDPYAGEIAKPLYSLDSFREIYRILSDDGVLATQAGNSFFYGKEYRYVYENISMVFKHVVEYWTWIPSFAYSCNFILASKIHDPHSLSEITFDDRLRDRGVATRYINGKRYVAMINLGVVTSI